MTNQKIQSIPHQNGLSIEGKSNPTHTKLQNEFTEFSTFGHFRVSNKSSKPSRIFVGIQDGLLYLLLFDEAGEVHHK
ncbi:MAG: hypothetical protein OXF49_02370 [Candidatus Saccharibacteria bacterium]|nr:hypothetical protein [Candidatus Saccharibacteria bacterium]